MAHSENTLQAEFWNSAPGERWAIHQAELDEINAGAADVLLARAAPLPGERVIDIGCGAGATSFALADAVGPSGHVVGVDISIPLLRRAIARKTGMGAQNIHFEAADAQDFPFPPGEADLIASRFGMMFFSDPVGAFRNMATGLRRQGRIAFVTWAGPEVNPWFTLPQRLAIERLGAVAPAHPDAPGPMAFRDIARVLEILEDAGFVDCRGEQVPTDLHHSGGLEALVDLTLQIGPIARVMREKNGTEDDLAALQNALTHAFSGYRSDDGVRVPAGLNLYTAIKP